MSAVSLLELSLHRFRLRDEVVLGVLKFCTDAGSKPEDPLQDVHQVRRIPMTRVRSTVHSGDVVPLELLQPHPVTRTVFYRGAGP